MRPEDRLYGGASCGSESSPSTPYPTASLTSAAKTPYGYDASATLVRERVVVDGIVLTRAQIIKAVQIASVPEPKTLDTSEFSRVYVSFGEKRIAIERRMSGRWTDKGLFLDAPPTGYEWAVIDDDLNPTTKRGGYRALVIRPIA